MKLSDLVDKPDATVIAGDDKLHIEIERIGASDMMSDILAASLGSNSILLSGRGLHCRPEDAQADPSRRFRQISAITNVQKN